MAEIRAKRINKENKGGKLINAIILLILFLQILSLDNSSYIELKIPGPGTRSLFFEKKENINSCPITTFPDEIYINNIKQDNISSQYYLNKSENIIRLKYTELDTIKCMFYECSHITKIDFSHFDSSKVSSMSSAFIGCISLKEINFDNFDTSKITIMSHLFQNCKSLTSLNLSSFDTSKVINMTYMFYNCQILKSLDLSNFDTSNVKEMRRMFRDCRSLQSLDLSNFNTTQTQNMQEMFYECESLTSINLCNFDISNVIYIQSMFLGCKDLEYINLKNAYENKELNFTKIFEDIPENIVICLNETSAPNLTSLIKNKICYNIDCSNDWIKSKKNFVNETEKCNYSCIDIYTNYIYENDNKCYISCLCKSCNTNFYPKENDLIYKNYYFNCYNNPEGYYLDIDENYINNSIYKSCYNSCKTCGMKGDDNNHNCLTCKDNYNFLRINENNQLNCYMNCIYYYFLDFEGKYQCTKEFQCPQEFNKLQKDRNECIKDCSSEKITKYEFQNICYEKCPEKTEISLEKKYFCEPICDEERPFKLIDAQECADYCDINLITKEKCIINYKIVDEKDTTQKEIKIQNKILETVEKSFTSDNYNTSNLDNGKNDVIKNKEMIITLTTVDNQKNENKNNNNMTNINLGDCENILREIYNISSDKKLYMKKIEIQQEGMKIPKVEFDVYCKLNLSNLIKLNLSYCNNTRAEIFVPVQINESIDKLNSSSGYYNDICYTTTSDYGTDITLKDRKNDFIKNNKTVCQEDCVFAEYDYDSQKAKCSCKIKESSSLFEYMKINSTKLWQNFKEIRNIVNTGLLICYKVLFSVKGIKNNIGSYIVLASIILHIISIFIFYKKQLKEIKEKIRQIVYGLNNWHLVKGQKKSNKKKEEQNTTIKLKKQNNIPEKNEDKKEKEEGIQFGNIIKINSFDNFSGGSNPIKKSKHNINKFIIQNYVSNNNININNNDINKDIMLLNENNSNQLTKEEVIKKTKEILSKNDQELNNLSYKLALQHDSRTYLEYYFSLIITKHILIFTFYYNKDYNSRIIKIDLFFIGFIINFAVNALFFSDNTINKIYEDKGKFSFIYQLPKIIYSSIISVVLNILLKSLALSEGDILKLKAKKSKKNLDKREKDLKSKLIIKFLLFFILSTIFLLFFWYYLAMFCAVYTNTQAHLINDTLISFGLSFVYPLGIYLIPGLFRINALSNKKECLYKLSQFIQMI